MVGRRGDRHLSDLAGRQRTRGEDDPRWVGEQYEEIHTTHWKSDFFAQIHESLIDTMIEHAERITSPHSAVLMMHLGGAPARVAPTLNAVGFRSAQYVLNTTAAWEASHEDQQHIGWAREFWGAAHPLSTGVGYTNFMTEDEGDARVRAAYGEDVCATAQDEKRVRSDKPVPRRPEHSGEVRAALGARPMSVKGHSRRSEDGPITSGLPS